MKLLAAEIKDIFGQISPPPAIKTFIGPDTTGTAGISKFLSNLITLFYTVAGIVLIFMLLWGAWDWITSEGNKEKLQSAQQKIISAVIGIALFAVAFGVIAVLGQFTGFKFFEGQGVRKLDSNTFVCPDGRTTYFKGTDPVTACK